MKKITRLILLIVAIVAWGNVANAQNTECAGTSTDPSTPSQGTFTLGYNYTFTTVGTDVTVTFELLDAQVGLVAYAWTYNPGFAEAQMTQGTGQKFSKTFTGQTIGATFNVACKFAYAGGMAVTKTFAYTVGNSCVVGPPDTEIPAAFTATKGAVTANTVELLLNGTDNSGVVTYTITYGTTTLTTSSTSGVQKSYIVTGLTPSTAYSFSVSAKDAANNQAANNPIVIPATTVAVPAPTVSAPTPPVYSAPKVISIYSDAYTSLTGTNFAPGWGQATVKSNITIGTDNIMKYSNFNYQGTVFNHSATSTMVALHLDVWTPNETKIDVYPICWNGTANEAEKFITKTLTQNQWNSIDIPVADFKAKGLTMADVYQLKLVGSGGTIVYLDNIYFYDNAVTVDTQAPTAFTATKGIVASDAVELLFNATDDSGAVTYTISYGAGPTVLTAPGISATQKSYTVSGLTGSTDYSFSVVAKDATGNVAANSPIVVTATTLAAIAAAPVPTYDAAKVISIYSDNYTSVMKAAGWEDWYGNTFSSVSLGGNTTLKDIATCCFGASFATATINVSAMTHLHVDIYPITATTMNFGFFTTGAAAVVEKTLTLTTGQWNSINLSLSDLKTLYPTVDYTQVKQMSFGGGAIPTAGTFYLDNLLFYNDGTTAISDVITENNISCYPNPIANNVTVSAKTEISQVIIRNLLGQSVNSTYIHGLSKTIDLSNVASGNYFITLKLANGQVSTQKIVKL